MKTEDERIRALFEKNMEQITGSIPDFESMWEKTVKNHKRRQRFIWKIAASIFIVATIGVYALLIRQDYEVESTISITAWSEPTKSLILPRSGYEVSGLATWTSPTDFLLPKNNQPISN